MNINVTKRDGSIKPYNTESIKKTIQWGVDSIKGVDALALERKILIHLRDEIPSTEIMQVIINASLKMISVEEPNWSLVAGRLKLMDLNKNVRYTYNKLSGAKNNDFKFGYHNKMDKFKWMIKTGKYSEKFLEHFTDSELNECFEMMDQDKDLEYHYSSINAMDKQYLIKLSNSEVIELPQEMYIATAMFLTIPYHTHFDKLVLVKKFYTKIKNMEISPATPIVMNMRKPNASGTSCEIVRFDDSLNIINYVNSMIMEDTSKGTGFGAYIGDIRCKGSWISGIPNVAGGSTPYVKIINDIISATDQLGARDGNITVTQDIWHGDILEFIELKDENGDQREKAHDIFRAISVPDIFMEREKAKADWTLFDPYEIKKVTGIKLNDLYGDEFREMYLKCEEMAENGQLKITRKVNARKLFASILMKIPEAGDPMFFFRDNVNKNHQNAHFGMIVSSNLCHEILSVLIADGESITVYDRETKTVKSEREVGYSPTCNLASINLSELNEDNLIDTVDTVVMMLNAVTIMTVNANPSATRFTEEFSSIGIGYIGYGHLLAKKGLMYGSPEAIEFTDKLAEKISMEAVRSSAKLAKIYGKYDHFEGSKWSESIYFGKHISELSDDWIEVDKLVQEFGMKNGYLFAIAPNTGTSVLLNTLPSIYPAKGYIIQKDGKAGKFNTPIPDLDTLQWNYKTLDRVSHDEYIKTVATFQKWIDMGVSMEMPIDMNVHTPKDIYQFYRKCHESGIKTTYYSRPKSINCVGCAN